MNLTIPIFTLILALLLGVFIKSVVKSFQSPDRDTTFLILSSIHWFLALTTLLVFLFSQFFAFSGINGIDLLKMIGDSSLEEERDFPIQVAVMFFAPQVALFVLDCFFIPATKIPRFILNIIILICLFCLQSEARNQWIPLETGAITFLTVLNSILALLPIILPKLKIQIARNDGEGSTL